MKIAIINNLYIPYARGGAERVVEKIAREARNNDDEVLVITTRLHSAPNLPSSPPTPSWSPPLAGGETYCKGEEFKIYYLPSIFYDLNKYPLALRFFWHLWDSFNFINYFKIRKILSREKPDLIWTHNLKGLGFLTFLLPRQLKIRHRHTLHDIQLLHPSGLMIYKKEGIIKTPWAKIYQALNKFFIQSPDEVVSPSRWLLNLHSQSGFFPKSKKIVEPNFDIEKKLPKSPNCQLPTTNYQFLYVGQIEKHKGVKMLVEVFRELPQKNIKLKIAGPGSLEKEIKKLAAKDGRMEILGRKNQEEIKALMKSSDCLIVPSLCYENSPTVIYEAISAGLPIIASDLGGIPELIGEIGGFLFKPGNADDLKKKIEIVIGKGRG